jgi:predicted nucleic acid-binding protein
VYLSTASSLVYCDRSLPEIEMGHGDREVATERKPCVEYPAVILIDSDVPMYLVGALHPHKSDAQRLLEKLVSERRRLVTDAEVLQEILHRYVAIDRRDAIQPAFDALLGVVDQVLPIDGAAAERAKEIVLGHRRLSARDAVHLAVMEKHGIEHILSFDCGLTNSLV